MAFYPNRLIFEYTGGTQTIIYTNTTGDSVRMWNVVKYTMSDDYSVDIVSTSTTECSFVISTNANNDTVQKNFIVHLVYAYEGDINTKRATYTFSVKPNPAETSIRPIYRDVYYNKPQTDLLSYTISVGDETIYSGKAFAEPDGNVNFNINKICHNYLFNRIDFNSPIINTDYIKEFKVNSVNNVGNTVTIGRYTFYNSYDYDGDIDNFNLNKPIKTVKNKSFINLRASSTNEYVVVDSRQRIMVSEILSPNSTATVSIPELGRENEFIGVLETIDSTTTDTLCQYTNAVRIPNNHNGWVMVENSSTDVSKYLTGVNVSNVPNYTIYKVEDTCYDYCLYYCNAVGGWDSLLIKGNTKKTDKINSQYYDRSFNNTTVQFEKKKYVNIITPTYTLYTDWFTDEEQSKFYHLLESTEVYLHNLITDKIEPVNITNNTCEYKTFTNNGKKKWYNKIDVEVAQEKIRR